MNRLDDMEALARRTSPDDFTRNNHFPVFVSRYVAEGDLRKSTTGRSANGPRGLTMQHVKASTELLLQPVTRERWIGIHRAQDGYSHPWLAVGRDRRSDVMINDYTISAIHAQLFVLPLVGRILLADAGSTNATAHNGTVLETGEQQMLVDGDEVRFGRLVFTFFHARSFYRYLLGEWTEPRTLVS